MIHSLGQDIHLLVLVPRGHLIANVIDRAADHKADRVETSLAYQQKLIDAEIAGKERFMGGIAAHYIEAFACMGWQVTALLWGLWGCLTGHNDNSFFRLTFYSEFACFATSSRA